MWVVRKGCILQMLLSKHLRIKTNQDVRTQSIDPKDTAELAA